MTQHSVQYRVVEAIQAFLIEEKETNDPITLVSSKLNYHLNQSIQNTNTPISLPSQLSSTLDEAIQSIYLPSLQSICESIQVAKNELTWQVDEGLFYGKSADVGEGYLKGNMHTELIGPNGCVFLDDNFRLGLFLLAPTTLYRDHAHVAPELYLNLTGPTGWRFDRGAWQDVEAGEVLWNPSGKVHATRTYKRPFLAVYSWTQDIYDKCQVIPADDWTELEKQLIK